MKKRFRYGRKLVFLRVSNRTYYFWEYFDEKIDILKNAET
jgi:hypothetical protein